MVPISQLNIYWRTLLLKAKNKSTANKKNLNQQKAPKCKGLLAESKYEPGFRKQRIILPIYSEKEMLSRPISCCVGNDCKQFRKESICISLFRIHLFCRCW